MKLLHTLINPNASGSPGGDMFGEAVALQGSYCISGAPGESGDSTWSNGKAYIYSNGVLLHTLDNPHNLSGSYFGRSVGICPPYCVVGADNDAADGNKSGAVYIFSVIDGMILHTLVNPDASADAWYGDSVAICNSYSIVGATGVSNDVGRAYIFSNLDGSLLHILNNPNPSSLGTFGHSVAIHGSYCIVSSPGESSHSGKAYIFSNSSGALLHTLDNPNAEGASADDRFGQSVAICGSYCIVGASGEDDAGGDSSGKAYIFSLSSGALLHTLDNPNDHGTSENDYFGYSVAVNDSCSLVGAYGDTSPDGAYSGKAYLFSNIDGSLLQVINNPNVSGGLSNDKFGRAVALDDFNFIIGALGEKASGDSYSGAAYIFEVVAPRTDWQDDDFNSRKKLTVKKEFVHGTPRNIPVKVDFSSDDKALLYAMTHYHTGAMLRVFTSDNVEIPCEAGVRYIQGEPDQIRLFFLAPELSSVEDTVFYLYYGSSRLAPITFKDADVWLPNGNNGVWHDGYEIVGAYAKSLGRY